jgi:hypothetical protein
LSATVDFPTPPLPLHTAITTGAGGGGPGDWGRRNGGGITATDDSHVYRTAPTCLTCRSSGAVSTRSTPSSTPTRSVR